MYDFISDATNAWGIGKDVANFIFKKLKSLTLGLSVLRLVRICLVVLRRSLKWEGSQMDKQKRTADKKFSAQIS